MHWRKFWIIYIVGILTTQLSTAQPEPLWEGQAPQAMGNSAADIPTLEIFKPNPNDANGSAILMVPGGSYGTVVMSEAQAARNYFIPKGFIIAVLKYRVAPYKYPVPMLDVKRAMRTLRNMAEELEVDTKRIGLLGCSAGGHLASYLATHYDMGDAEAEDPIEREHCRPDFSIFVYPVITMDPSFTHGGSRSNLLGNNPPQDLVDSLSNEKQVNDSTPPSFLVHGTVDNVVPWKNSEEFFLACEANSVPAKFHKITSGCGGHGFGYDCENWGDVSYAWLKDGGYLDATAKVKFSPKKATGNFASSLTLYNLNGKIRTHLSSGNILANDSLNNHPLKRLGNEIFIIPSP